MSIYVSPYYSALRTTIINSLFGFSNSASCVGYGGGCRNIAASIAQQRLANYLLNQAIHNLALLSASSNWLGGGNWGSGFSGLRYGGPSYSGYGDYHPHYGHGGGNTSQTGGSSSSGGGTVGGSSGGSSSSGVCVVEDHGDSSHAHGNHGAGHGGNDSSSSISDLNIGNLVSNPPQNGTVSIQMQQTTSQNIQLTYTNAHLSSISYSQSNSSVFKCQLRAEFLIE